MAKVMIVDGGKPVAYVVDLAECERRLSAALRPRSNIRLEIRPGSVARLNPYTGHVKVKAGGA